MSTYGFTSESQSSLDPIVLGTENTFKPITIAAGENTVAQGQLLARDPSTNTYKKLLALASASEAVSMGQDAVKTTISGATTNKPILPGSVSALIGGVTFSDSGSRRGLLSGTDGFGTIDYSNGKLALSLKTAPVTASTCTVSYYHFGNAGALDIKDIVVNSVKAESATSAVKTTALSEGFINPLRVTPTVDRTDAKTYLCFKDSGLRLKAVETLS